MKKQTQYSFSFWGFEYLRIVQIRKLLYEKSESLFFSKKQKNTLMNNTLQSHPLLKSFSFHLTGLSSIGMLNHDVVGGVNVESLTLNIPVVATRKLVLHASTNNEHQVCRKRLAWDRDHKRVVICE